MVKETIIALTLIIPLSLSPKLMNNLVDDVENQFPMESYKMVSALEKNASDIEKNIVEQRKGKNLANKIEKAKKYKKEKLSLIFDISEFDSRVSNFKTYMDYTAIIDTSSKQYKLQQKASTDKYGLRKIGKYYCIAVGTGICKKVGTKIVLEKSNNEKIYAIVAEIKSDRHTDNSHITMKENDTMLEFVVDVSQMNASVASSGNISNIDKFKGKISKIYRVIKA